MKYQEMSPYSDRHLILEKVAKMYTRKKAVSLTSVAGKTGYPHVED
jgi:hypothetical protein